MIPLFVTLRVSRRKRTKARRLWLPLFLVWLLLAPLLLILLPVFFLVCLALRINPFRALAAIWSVLWALGGTHIEVDTVRETVLIHIF